MLGVPHVEIAQHFRYIAPPGPITPNVLLMYRQEELAGATLAIIDANAESMTAEGLDPAKQVDVVQWMAMLPHAVRAAGATLVVIDHVVKNRQQRGRFAIGSEHKLAGADVAYSFHMLEPFAPGLLGRASIIVRKDRHGGIRSFALDRRRAATFELDSRETLCAAFQVPREPRGESDHVDALLVKFRACNEPMSKSGIARLHGNQANGLTLVDSMLEAGMLVQAGSRGGHPPWAPVDVVEDGEDDA